LEESEYDCVLLLGDIYRKDAKNIAEHAGGKPCLYVSGNHDEWGQNEGIPGMECIDGRTVEVCGVKISGAGGGRSIRMVHM
jgi:predicted phosphodiesterase